MRPTLWLGLVALCVGASLVRIPCAAARDARSAQSAARTAFTRTVEGFGVTKDAARDFALEKARDVVADYLAEPGYRPTVEKLQKLKIVPPADEMDMSERKFEKIEEPMQEAKFDLRLTEDQVKALRAEARHERVAERQHWMGLGLAAAVSLLLVAIGYLRLEEATKGYYTGLLRLSALGVLALIGFFIWQLS
jgi:hypothetical protein